MNIVFLNIEKEYQNRYTQLSEFIEHNKKVIVELCEDISETSYTVEADEEKYLITGGSYAAISEAFSHLLSVFETKIGDTNYPELPYRYAYDAFENAVDNSALIPEIKNDTDVLLVPANKDNPDVTSPDWISDLIIAEVHIATATADGTLKTAGKLVDFYAGMGVNAIWLCPIYDRDHIGNGYGNRGLHTVDTEYTGCTDYDDGWDVVRDFIEYAHSKNIRIILDIISWGVMNESAVRREHPEWFDGVLWGGQAYNWKNEAFCDWFVSNAVKNILYTKADGYRCDCEPNHGGYRIWGRIRKELHRAGRKPLIISEDFSERSGEFDLEQDGVLDYCRMSRGELYGSPIAPYLSGIDIVESIKTGYAIGVIPTDNRPEKWGQARFYTNCVTNHDYVHRLVRGNLLVIGYQAILAPFIPLWFCGDELSMAEDDKVIYFSKIEWERIQKGGDPAASFFFENLKKLIRIRRLYRDIFSEFPLCHRDSNICRAEIKLADGSVSDLCGYMRYKGDRAVLVVPAKTDGRYTVKIPFEASGLNNKNKYKIINPETGRMIAGGNPDELSTMETVVCEKHIGVYLIEREDN